MRTPADPPIDRFRVTLAGAEVDSLPPEASDGRTDGRTDGYSGVRTLIWLYFWLLILEGALRKWILPGLSDVVLVIRDPVLLLCYYLALKHRAFPRTVFLPCILGLAAIAAAFSAIGILAGATRSTFVVLLYGLRANFLHLPLIFLIANVFTRRDVEKVGKWLLMMAFPMLLLVYFQYRAAPDAWVNVGAKGLEGGQIGVAVSGVDKIRPPGVFTYNTGLTAYLVLVAAFLSAHYLAGRKLYLRWLAILGTLTLVASVPLAMSRSTSGALAIVSVASVVCVMVRPELRKGGVRIVLLLGIVLIVVGSSAFFREGMDILGARFVEAEGMKVGIVDRMVESFTAPVKILSSAPFLGAGLGVGTNVGAKLLTGSTGFLLAEGDWDRDVAEMGPVVGVLYILLRIGIVGSMVLAGWKSLKGGSPLSVLLLSAGGLSLLNGNFAQPTALGFAVFGGGLCLAAAKEVQTSKSAAEILSVESRGPRIRGRSRYAEQLHGHRL